MKISTRREVASDIAAIREVNRQAFGQEGEGRLVDLLRDGGYMRLSLVSEVDGEIVGHILFSDLTIHTDDGRTVAALALAPMAVKPEFQRRGIGGQLIGDGLARCKAEGHRIVVVFGHPEYYPRFGFSPALAANLACPYPAPPEAWMALELASGALDGVRGRVEYSPPFSTVASGTIAEDCTKSSEKPTSLPNNFLGSI
jgi:putative acetyltransferase